MDLPFGHTEVEVGNRLQFAKILGHIHQL
jgi:hypothetical protein